MSRVKCLLIFFCLSLFPSVNGQEIVLFPLSSAVFNPFSFNPAISGSKDFTAIGIIATMQGENSSQQVSMNTRFIKRIRGYASSPDAYGYSNLGMGISGSHSVLDTFEYSGMNAALSYHIPLGSDRFSFLSTGGGFKAVYDAHDKSFHPDADFGLYLYSRRFFAGGAIFNAFSTAKYPDSITIYKRPLERMYFAMLGYRFLVSRSLEILVEPSLMAEFYDEKALEFLKNFHPSIKVYMKSFCMGTYFYSGNTSFFFQYKFPAFYMGAYFEIPEKAPYYKFNTKPYVEITLGLNISHKKGELPARSIW